MRGISIAIFLIVALISYQHVQGTDSTEKLMDSNTHTAYFAGGCFWCSESDFEKVNGVIEAISGYTGGHVQNPSYKQVSAGGTGHVEAVKVVYDPKIVSYEMLLDVFWRHVDPTDKGGQFVDRGRQYGTAIFYTNSEQKQLAENSKKMLSQSGRYDKPIVTPILKLGTFYKAEEYHQNYYKKRPLRYKYYRSNSGRDQYLERIWREDQQPDKQSKLNFQKPSDEELRHLFDLFPAISWKEKGMAFMHLFLNKHELITA